MDGPPPMGELLGQLFGRSPNSKIISRLSKGASAPSSSATGRLKVILQYENGLSASANANVSHYFIWCLPGRA